MSDYAATVRDVSRAVAVLNEHPDDVDAVARVSSNLAFQFARHHAWGGRKNVTARDVRYALISHGADTLTVERNARRIASRIRADFSDGWRYHEGF